jgi:hypothetical protein
MIANERPQDAFAGEETGTTEGMSGRRGLVDPLCGTLNPSSRSLTLGVNCDGKRDVPFRGAQLGSASPASSVTRFHIWKPS